MWLQIDGGGEEHCKSATDQLCTPPMSTYKSEAVVIVAAAVAVDLLKCTALLSPLLCVTGGGGGH